ncbi:hypothetical protein GGP41_003032 [Bipolaris sorokiniana]|uniref:Uncharacterized protein n=1 Tax=Cochliobolus sativus TaxID=45130 RepID=A0A8H5ZA67_COCSA|nr:hypothetical protein GGP41_003032 [Bipolaris sorokiniana]
MLYINATSSASIINCFSRASVSRYLLGSLATSAAALRDSVATAKPLLLYIVSLSALLSML